MSFVKSFVNSALNSFLTNSNEPAMLTLSCEAGYIDFPVMPEAFEISVSNQNSTVNINNSGQYNMIGKTGLKSISIASFFPCQQYSFCLTQAEEPASYIRKIESWRTSSKVLHITISNTNIDMHCLIESFSFGCKDCTADVYFKIDLKEYRYIEGTAPTINKKTGLNTRPKMSFLEKTAMNFKYMPGDSPMQALGRAVGKTAGTDMTKEQASYLRLYEATQKHGGINVGDTINIINGGVKINDKNIYT